MWPPSICPLHKPLFICNLSFVSLFFPFASIARLAFVRCSHRVCSANSLHSRWPVHMYRYVLNRIYQTPFLHWFYIIYELLFNFGWKCFVSDLVCGWFAYVIIQALFLFHNFSIWIPSSIYRLMKYIQWKWKRNETPRNAWKKQRNKYSSSIQLIKRSVSCMARLVIHWNWLIVLNTQPHHRVYFQRIQSNK